MDLRLSEEQEMLKTSVRDFLATECPKTAVRELEEGETGHSPELWKKMAELGWMGLIIPEEYEGTGLTFQDLMAVVEETGRNILPGPFLSTIVGSFPILDAGTEEQKKEFLPGIARGEIILSTAFLEDSGLFDASGIAVKATAKGDGFVINGTKVFVELAHVADYLVCAARTGEGASPEEGITLFMVDTRTPGIYCEVIPTIGMDKQREVRFVDVVVPGKRVLGEVDKGWPLMQSTLKKGALVKCAESVGGMQACVDMTVEYSKERVQYERPIGAFQALQHLMADMWIAMQTSRYLVYEAGWLESEGLPSEKEVSMAKTYVNEAYRLVSKWGVRLHGGIGTSREHDISLYYRRAKAADIAFGGSDFHSELVAEKIGLV